MGGKDFLRPHSLHTSSSRFLSNSPGIEIFNQIDHHMLAKFLRFIAVLLLVAILLESLCRRGLED